MGDFAIRIQNLSKQYRIGGHRARPRTLAEALGQAVSLPMRSLRARDDISQRRRTIWALKDLCLDVRCGEILGIIGRNGAGKSTLLKILSRITEPTEGYADVRGRVGSLLEVGTGFHPELTGRENIMLNGAILGMSRAEISKRFDEIVAFAEVEQFVDTPVKHYSSGMYLRLAFAVAAHLETEILLVDEVLAVGDLLFQKKCLSKMGSVVREGRTVLFISHNLGAVAKLCQTGIVVDRGTVAKSGNIDDAISYYTRMLRPGFNTGDVGNGGIQITNLSIQSGRDDLDFSRESEVRFQIRIPEEYWGIRMLMIIRDADDLLLVRQAVDSSTVPQLRRKGTYHVHVRLPPLWLRSGQYSCHIKVLADGIGGKQRQVSDPLLVTARMYDYEDRESDGTEILSPTSVWTIDSIGEVSHAHQ